MRHREVPGERGILDAARDVLRKICA